MPRVAGIRFKAAGKIYYFDPMELELALGDGAVVETARGLELGTVATAPKEVPEEQVKAPLKKVVRKATAEDLARKEENEQKTKRAFQVGLQKIAAHGLPMKLVDVECTLDGAKITFYFTAESRVDFRDLVKDLASSFRTRIELRQIGVRDEAKLLGGLGSCGRQLCCQAFLGDFVPVSIKMAKEQNLSLNPSKISGICGRLMCCLNFESEAYREAKRAAANRQEASAAPPESTPAAAQPAAAAAVEPDRTLAPRTDEPARAGEATGEAGRSGAAKRRRRRKRPTEREAGAERVENAPERPPVERQPGKGQSQARPQGGARGPASGRSQGTPPREAGAANAPNGEGRTEGQEARDGAGHRRRRPRRRKTNGEAPGGEGARPEGSPGE